MSRHDDRSAIDAIVEENLTLREKLDNLSIDENSDQTSRPEPVALISNAEQMPFSRSTKLGFADGTPVGGDDSDVAPEIAEVLAERDSYLADSQRLAADFANYRKQSDKRVADAAAAQSAGLVRNLLPVIDACDSALEQDPESAAGPIRSALLSELEKSGLELLAPEPEAVFDPELHEAVMHEAGTDSGPGEPTVSEVFRAGYVWKGKVLRPAMVKVVG